ncbi:mandelate racemase/muconate lactonizing enzyme family protein [Ramlibacter sp. G-1-2-2]|uniref:Mandelate racemase/muconate lactonizing enzyme family protein n=1 Tax=Ramlibacter agri TaxID=2728837 RepID=A0A848H9Q5_9BURK|nr:mandelate racemase/muconate lactonizing enzyme family protein [Ramlibacter agri]
MKIERVDLLQAHGGWQVLSFLKLTASDGQAGWSEFSEGFTPGLTAVIRAQAQGLVGRDPREIPALMYELNARARPSAGGVNAQAAAAIENALLDLKARALGVPVYELFGGAVRKRIPVYASHTGMYRMRNPDLFRAAGAFVPRRMEDMATLGAEVAARGVGALKTNLLSFAADGTPRVHMPGFARGSAPDPALNATRALADDAAALVEQLRAGGGAGMGVMLDLNFNFKPEGVRRLAAALDPLGLEWLEVDGIDPPTLAALRASISTPIASLEAVYGRAGLLPYLEARAVDVAIIDPMWNGLGESVRMAMLADAFNVNVASHLFSGGLATAMAAHFCAVVPNLRIMEVDLDRVPWHDSLFQGKVEIREGCAVVPEGPGWGVVPDEEGMRLHP